MASRDCDAPLCIEGDDGRPVKCTRHLARFSTFCYLSPLYVERRSPVKPFFFSATITYGRFCMCNMSRILHRHFSALSVLMKVECEEAGSPGRVP